MCPPVTLDTAATVPTVAREEVGSLIGAVVLSCRLRARGVSHHHQDETL